MTTLAPDSPLRQAIQGYIDQLLAIPTRAETDFRIKGRLDHRERSSIAVLALRVGGLTGDGVQPTSWATTPTDRSTDERDGGGGMVHSARDAGHPARARRGGDGVTINFGGVTLAGAADADRFARHLMHGAVSA